MLTLSILIFELRTYLLRCVHTKQFLGIPLIIKRTVLQYNSPTVSFLTYSISRSCIAVDAP